MNFNSSQIIMSQITHKKKPESKHNHEHNKRTKKTYPTLAMN